MAKTRKKRTNYTTAQRQTILAAAQKDGLTATQVKKKFGVTPVTYYSWRKKSGVAGAKTVRARLAKSGVRRTGGFESQLRDQVQSRIREMLPEIVRTEVDTYLGSLFGTGRKRRLRT
jgi:transposase-like protein